MIVHVCQSDGQAIGQFEEEEFRQHIFANRFPQDSYYWHEGMEDWHPIADYRALAKTQRISFAPPLSRTVRINIEPNITRQPPKPENSVRRLWKRLTGRK
ncbi:MAG TPA: DUF4339 domain-containing protein [Chthoniobacterales bacterium]|nr:DUF4339 domain-containing protein [Chthoniobacterales bacterium]